MSLAMFRFPVLHTTLGLTPGDSALLLLLLGILLIYSEFNRPGTILMGAVGSLLCMLGVNQFLPLHFALPFALLTLAGVALLLLELRFPNRRLPAAGALAGTLALVLGLHKLILPPNNVHWVVAVLTGVVFSVVTYALGRIALLAARNKRLPNPHFAASNLKPHPASPGKSGSAE